MQFSFAQEKTVTGVVTDGKLPLPGANVIIKGSSKGSSTDMDGKFSIKAKAGDVLEISSIGYDKKTVTVGAANSYNVTLKEEAAKVLDEVLVTGAVGIKRRPDAVTSTTQLVKGKDLTQAGNPNAIQALVGKVSGLQINTISNGASPDTKILLRGTRSITGNNSALVVIDNVISSASVLGQLPPDVIESVNVLKGQQGGALYGDQGSNGVIIVTTKKGTKDSKVSVSVNSSIDFQQVSFLPKRQTLYGQGWGTDDAYNFDFPNVTDPRNNDGHFSPYENGAWGPAFNDPIWANTEVPTGLPQANGQFITEPWKTRGYDNIRDFFKTGNIIQNNVSVSAGNQDDGYVLFSYGRQTNDFVVENDRLKRNTFILRAGKKINKFRIGGTVNYISQSLSQTDSDLFDDLLQTPTNVDINKFRNSGHEGHWTVYAKNPFRTIKQTRFDDLSDFFNGAVDFSYDFNKHINASYTGNVTLRSIQNESHNDGFTNIGLVTYNFAPYTDNDHPSPSYEDLGGLPENSSYFITQSFGRNYYGDLMLNFDYDLTKDVNFKLNVGNNIQDNYYRVNSQGGTSLETPGFYNIKNVLQRYNPGLLSNFTSLYRKAAFFGNLDLAYKDYLFLNATGRYEKSSAVKDWVFYPSVGLSFVPTKAFDALKDNKVLNYLKLNASYVQVGNSSPVPAYATNNTAQLVGGYPYADLISYQVRRNQTQPLIKPEIVSTFEVGAAMGLLKDRITLEGSYYVTDTKDMITQATSSRTTGLTSILDNTGSLRNKGFEIDLGFTPFKSTNGGFNWNLKTSYSHSKTIVTSLSNGVNSVNLSSNTFIGVFAEVGEQFPLIKGTAFVKDPSGNIIVDANGNPQRTSTFQTLGKSTPDFIVGLTNTFSYKGVSLKAVADYRTGHSFYSEAYATMAFSGYTEESASQDRFGTGYVVPGSVQLVGGNYVANSTPVNASQGPSQGTLNYFSGIYNRTGEAMLIDASALKIREIALSYDLPKKMLKGTGINSFTFGVNARNPFIFFFANGHGIKNKGYADPESNAGSGNAIGLSNVGQYPSTRTYGFTVNVTF
jgi:TonB-linked SusC/RagA family outer membrane protein